MTVRKFVPGETLGATRMNEIVSALPQEVPGQGQSRGTIGKSGVNVPNAPKQTEHVFQGIVKPGDKDVLTIGIARDYTDYALTDNIEIHTADEILVIDKSGASEDVTVTEDGHVYYEINADRDTATLKFNADWPPDDYESYNLYHRLGTVEFVTDRITIWHQIELENIILAEGGSELNHPFKGSVDEQDIIIGADRLTNDFSDIIMVQDHAGVLNVVTFSGEDAIEIPTDTTQFVYYEVSRNSGGTWSATLSIDTSWPPSQERDELHWRVGIAVNDTDTVTWGQEQFSNPVLMTRRFLADFQPYYIDDGDGTESVVINSGRLECDEGAGAVTGATYPLEDDAYIYISVSVAALSKVASIGAMTSSASRLGYMSFVAGAVQMYIPVGRVIDDIYYPEQLGTIKLGSVLYGTDAAVLHTWLSEIDGSVDNVLTFSRDQLNANPIGGKLQSNIVQSDTADQVTFDGVWVKQIDKSIEHDIPAPGSGEDWETIWVSSTNGGTTDVEVVVGNMGHLLEVDGDATPGADKKYKYVNCDDPSDYHFDVDILGSDVVIEVDDECYERGSLVATQESDWNPTVGDSHASCVACLAALARYKWRNCDGDAVVAVFTAGNNPADSYAYICSGGVWVRCYYDKKTSDAATAGPPATSLRPSCESRPTSCATMTGIRANDSFSGIACDSGSIGDTEFDERWTESTNSTYPTKSITGNSYVAVIPGAAPLRKVELTLNNLSVTGDFSFKMNLTVSNTSSTAGPEGILLCLGKQLGWIGSGAGVGTTYYSGGYTLITSAPAGGTWEFEFRRASGTVSVRVGGVEHTTFASAAAATFVMDLDNHVGGSGSATFAVNSVEVNDNANGNGTGNIIYTDLTGVACP